jgi:hypothetical protein
MTQRVLVAAAVAAATALAAAGGRLERPGEPAAPAPPAAAVQAEALANAPAPGAASGRFDAASARRQAALRGLGIPLPAGGTFNGVRWEQGGDVTAAQMDGVLEYNAMCQWLRAWRDRREPLLAAHVLQTVPGWPALRGTEAATTLTRVAAQVRGARGRLAGAVLRDCDASHRREVAYAKELGLPPSS